MSSFITAYIYKEVFAEGDYGLQLDVSSPVILDVGANTGLFSLGMKQLLPDAQIACFEPEPANFEQIQPLITLNCFHGAKVYKKEIGAETKNSTLFLHPKKHWGHSLIKQEPDWLMPCRLSRGRLPFDEIGL